MQMFGEVLWIEGKEDRNVQPINENVGGKDTRKWERSNSGRGEIWEMGAMLIISAHSDASGMARCNIPKTAC
ncbi:MAG: hypothetical protein DYG96_13495 [Chlorobi bacterium CHB2]|nr:hypothetical protein [Chlorobi bacterium CHB2]